MKYCKTCQYRWIKPGNFIDWYCRIPGKQLVRIGTQQELEKAKGCVSWQK